MREYVIGHNKRDADHVARRLDINPVYAVTRERVCRGFLRGQRNARVFVTEWAQNGDPARPNERAQILDMETQLAIAASGGLAVLWLGRDPW